MPPVSSHPLSPKIQKMINQQFIKSLTQLKNTSQTRQFFSDFLSQTELFSLSGRLAVAILLYRGKSQIQIKDALHVSNSKIGNVANWLKNASPATQKILASISKRKNWQTVIDHLEEILDKLPPGKTDWKGAGKEKFQRELARSRRRRLR